MGNPVGNDSVIRDSGSSRRPPLCGRIPDGFASTRLRPGSANSTRRPRSCLTMLKMVGRRVVPTQRQAKAPLAGECPVAGAHVAAGLGQRGNDVVAKCSRKRAGPFRLTWI